MAGLLALAGALLATLFLHREASAALDRVLEARLRGVGEAAAELLAGREPGDGELRAIVAASDLEAAYVLSPSLVVVADATGRRGRRADLLRTDVARVERAARGEASVAFGYSLGEHAIATGYFPIRGAPGSAAVLALEAGQAFAAERARLRRGLALAVALSFVGALALALVTRRWSRSEAARRREAEHAIRGDALARMGAMVAHEIRNPLGVIRGCAELVRSRSARVLAPRDAEALSDILEESDRLRRLTDDFLDLARDPAVSVAPVDVERVAADAAQGLSRAHPDLAVRVEGAARADADAGRLRQVLSNLLVNAAQAGARTIAVEVGAREGGARVLVRDDGPGVDPALRPRLFEPFATGRADGTGLGLALSRRIVERQGGTLRLLEGEPGGASFELVLPLSASRR
jgi:signal transduction histidine kinase